MNYGQSAESFSSDVIDGLLKIHVTLFMLLYGSNAVLALRPLYPGLLQKPVELFFLMLLPIMLRVHVPDYKRNGFSRTFDLWRDHWVVLIPFLCMIAWTALTAVLSGANLAYGQGKALYIFVYRFAMLAGALSTAIFLVKVGWRGVLILVLLVLLGSIFYDVAYPGSFSSLISRAGGFQENPNLAGTATVLLLAMVTRYDRVHPLDLLVILVAFIGVFATLSRGGMILFLVFSLNYLWFTGRGQRLKQVVLAPAMLAVMIVAGTVAVSTLTSSSEMFDAENAQRRLSTLAFDNDAVYGSDQIRLSLVPQYLRLIDQSVLAGHGAGFTRTMPYGPHNTYLFVWVEYGLIGLTFYVWFLLAIMLLCWQRHFIPGVVLAEVSVVAGFFNHTMLHLPVFLILAGTALGTSWVLVATNARRDKRASGTSNDPHRNIAGSVR